MNLETLCNGINLQPELKNEVLDFYKSETFCNIKDRINGLKNMKTEAAARYILKEQLGEDEKQVKLLTCMLVCAAEQYEWYQEKSIPDSVFFATMRCFTRFISECEKITGILAFDREWWTARQLSGILFRIGELEYEMMHENNAPVISMHIPSDSVLTPENCDRSIKEANRFFAERFPEYEKCKYICDSWLLAPELSVLLPAQSNIIAFQKRFTVTSVDYSGMEYTEWVFKTRKHHIPDFPEQTALQKNMKKYLLDGGKVGNGFGILNH